MRAPLASKLLDEAGGLVAELKAIEQWDAAYWRNPSPEEYETLAFVARGKRRCEILSRLLSMPPSDRMAGKERALDRQEIVHSLSTEKRRHPRLELEAELILWTESGLVPGRTLDISESGMSAILAVRLEIGTPLAFPVLQPFGTDLILTGHLGHAFARVQLAHASNLQFTGIFLSGHQHLLLRSL
jgi:hypothetical protein